MASAGPETSTWPYMRCWEGTGKTRAREEDSEGLNRDGYRWLAVQGVWLAVIGGNGETLAAVISDAFMTQRSFSFICLTEAERRQKCWFSCQRKHLSCPLAHIFHLYGTVTVYSFFKVEFYAVSRRSRKVISWKFIPFYSSKQKECLCLQLKIINIMVGPSRFSHR